MRIVIAEQFFTTKAIAFEGDNGFLKPVLDLDTTEETQIMVQRLEALNDITEIAFIGNLGIFKKIEEYYKINHPEVKIVWQ